MSQAQHAFMTTLSSGLCPWCWKRHLWCQGSNATEFGNWNCPNRRRSSFYPLPMRSPFSALKYKREYYTSTSCLYLFCIQASWERIFVHPRAFKSFLQRVRIFETRVGYDHYDGAISKVKQRHIIVGRAVLAPFKIPVLPYSSYTSPS